MSFSLSKKLLSIDILFNVLAFVSVIYVFLSNKFFVSHNPQGATFLFIFALVSLTCSFMELRSILVPFLFGLLSALVALRIGSVNNLLYVTIFFSLIFAFKCLSFANILINDVKFNKSLLINWHLIFIRMYIGLDLINHSVEKLFNGTVIRNVGVDYFSSIGIQNPLFLVIIAGLCEFFGAIGVGLGAFTRLASVGTALYILISTVLGDHFKLGFIWATPGGGYEFPLLWLVVILSFVFTGGQKFSVDAFLNYSINKCEKCSNNFFIKIIKVLVK